MVAVHLLHLLLLAEDVSKYLPLAEKFLQTKDTRDFLQARLRFEKPAWGMNLDDIEKSYLFDGSIIEVYAQLTTTDPNSRGSRITPLQIAIQLGDLAAVRTLLDAGVDPNNTESSEGTIWEDGTLISYFNHLDGASALYICREFGLYLEKGHPRLWREPFKRIEKTLLRYGAKVSLRV